ncbi:hypothetical protein [Actinomadura fibrosa]|uniref:Uncharacterized protein n=1 Tax=Actinomadura fibrosa TaxID=111802 RepID=A0ABW2XZ99_9ACTN|nr:hypothetical protein [Actinomadura fibrosa]
MSDEAAGRPAEERPGHGAAERSEGRAEASSGVSPGGTAPAPEGAPAPGRASAPEGASVAGQASAPEGASAAEDVFRVEAVPAPEPTGDSRVDDAVARLADLPGRAVPDHVEIFEDVHQRLQELLASADQDEPDPAQNGPQGAAQGGPQSGWAQGGPQGGAQGGGQAPRPAFPSALRPRPGNGR